AEGDGRNDRLQLGAGRQTRFGDGRLLEVGDAELTGQRRRIRELLVALDEAAGGKARAVAIPQSHILCKADLRGQRSDRQRRKGEEKRRDTPKLHFHRFAPWIGKAHSVHQKETRKSRTKTLAASR